MSRVLVSTDFVISLRPSAKRIDTDVLQVLCEDATSRIEGFCGRRFFDGWRTVDVTPTGGHLATLPDPPLREISSVRLNGDPDQELELDSFKIEGAREGVLWNADGWLAYDGAGRPKSENDRVVAGAHPGSETDAIEPVFWRVAYRSGSGARQGTVVAENAGPFDVPAATTVTLKIDDVQVAVPLTAGSGRTTAQVVADFVAPVGDRGFANVLRRESAEYLRIRSASFGRSSTVQVSAGAGATLLGLPTGLNRGDDVPASIRVLACEWVGLKLESIPRPGTENESIGRVSRAFDFDKAEASIRRRCRAMGARGWFR